MIKLLQSKQRSFVFSAHLKSAFLLLGAFLFSTTVLLAQTWPILADESQIATTATNNASITTVEVASGDDSYVTVPYVAYVEASRVRVKRLINGTWENVGVDGIVSSGNANHVYIFSDANGKIYLNYLDEASSPTRKLAIKTFNPANNAWETVGGNLHVSNGSILFSGHSELAKSRPYWMAFDSDNKPYIVYTENSEGNKPIVKRFNGIDWELVGTGPISAQKATGLGIAIDQSSNTIFVAYINQEVSTTSSGAIKLLSYESGNWVEKIIPTATLNGSTTTGSVNSARLTSIALDGENNPYIAYSNAANSIKATVIKYTRSTSTWSFSQILASRDTYSVSITRGLSGTLYVTHTDVLSSGGTLIPVRVWKLATGETTWSELRNITADPTYIDTQTSSVFLTVGANNREYLTYIKSNSSNIATPRVRIFAPPVLPSPPSNDAVVTTPKQMEALNRGVVAVRLNTNEVYIGWRMFGTDPSTISFNVYRDNTKVNGTPISTTTNFTDITTSNGTYIIKPIINGVEGIATKPVSVWAQNHLTIPLQIPAAGTTPNGEAYTYSANDASVGDLDGDGEYEIVLKWDPSNSKDNSQAGYTGNVYLDAYKLNGTRLWRIDLGKNIRAGAHYTQFMVYDLDGDGFAEVSCKTADGTVDGTGTVIGDVNADYRNSNGYILSGPEFLTVFNGKTGAAMANKNYLPYRGTVSSWGDNYGNRVDRFVAAVAYLDGARPSLVMGRGYYSRMVRAAWDWRDGQLTSRWVFDSNTLGNGAYFGQGNHQMTIGDIDGDGKDEIINGSSVINDNGAGFWANGKGHGDALHMSDMDPSIDGQEIWMSHEDEGSYAGTGLSLRKANTGELIWGVQTIGDVGRGMAADIDPRYPGYELWGSRGGNVYDSKGVSIGTSMPSMNFGIWWDGDLSRELLDGTRLDKWNTATNSTSRLFTINDIGNATSNNSTKATPNLTADILGDWREEMIYRSSDNANLLLFTTNIPTEHRIHTLMHDSQYRTAVAWQNSAYNQPPHPSFFLGTGMSAPAMPNIVLATPPPIVSYNGATSFCPGESLILTSSEISDNQWFKDGILIPGETNQTYTATATGSYTVKMLTSNASSPVVINVYPAPVANITANGSLEIAEGGSVVLSSTTAAGYTFKWLKDGTEINGATNADYTATEPGAYTVSVTLGTCTILSAATSVTPIITLPVISYTGAPAICQGESLLLTSTAPSGNQWYKDGLAIENAIGTSYSANISGSYTVKTATSSMSEAIVLIVNPVPTAIITTTGSLTFTHGGSVVLTASTGSGYTYKWMKNGVEVADAVAQNYTATESGNYTAIVTLNNCTTVSNPITLTKITTLSYNGSTRLCEGQGGLQLTSSASTGNQWFNYGVALAGETSQTLTVTASGSYTVSTPTSNLSEAVTITVNPSPTSTITANGPVIFLKGGSVTLTAGTGTNYTYQWMRNGSPIDGAISGTYSATESGNYTLLTSINSCSVESAAIGVTNVFTLPSTNFRVAVNGESCKTNNNGKISVTAEQNFNYTATLISNGVSTSYSFVNSLEIPNLTAGVYSLCISIDGKVGYKQCYENLTINEPQDLSVYSSVNDSDNTITLSLAGGKNYNVKLNGVVHKTDKSIITLPLGKGQNSISITTDSECQGQVEKLVTLHDNVLVYPNPFENVLSVKLNNAVGKADIEIRSLDGKLLYKKEFRNTDINIQMELSHFNSGIYLLKLSLDNLESFYKVIKR